MPDILSQAAAAELSRQPARGPIDTGGLDGFLRSISKYVGPAMILRPEKQLFHYTNLDGLLGIIQNRDLWLTDSRYSNDNEEMLHGHRVALGVIEKKLAKPRNASHRKYLERLQSLIGKPANQGVYIACFCAQDNLLSQWRGYGANGNGVSIKIEAGQLSIVTGQDCDHGLMRLWKVYYTTDEQEDIVAAAIKYSYDEAERRRGRGRAFRDTDIEQCAQKAADAIQFFIPTFKHPDFAEEKEWRIIFTPNDPCKVPPRFRVKGGMVVPYYSLKDVAAPTGVSPPPPLNVNIGNITVGPGANKALTVKGIQLLFKDMDVSTTVVASETPFRG